MWLINLIEEIFGKVVFRIGDYEFEGFRLFSYIELPWNNNIEMNEYMNGLEKENTPYSYKKFIYWDEQNHCQEMHIILSRAFLCLIIGILLLVLSVILIMVNIRTGSFFSVVASIIMIILNKFLKFRAKKYYTSLEMSQEIFKSNDTWLTSDEQK
jgi:hypothetical protein